MSVQWTVYNECAINSIQLMYNGQYNEYNGQYNECTMDGTLLMYNGQYNECTMDSTMSVQWMVHN